MFFLHFFVIQCGGDVLCIIINFRTQNAFKTQQNAGKGYYLFVNHTCPNNQSSTFKRLIPLFSPEP